MHCRPGTLKSSESAPTFLGLLYSQRTAETEGTFAAVKADLYLSEELVITLLTTYLAVLRSDSRR